MPDRLRAAHWLPHLRSSKSKVSAAGELLLRLVLSAALLLCLINYACIQPHSTTATTTHPQICCSKTLVAKPEHKDAVHELCKEVTQFSLTRMKDRAAGIQEFNCMVDSWEDNVVHFWERYDSNVTMGRHNTTPEFEGFMKKVCVAAPACQPIVCSTCVSAVVCGEREHPWTWLQLVRLLSIHLDKTRHQKLTAKLLSVVVAMLLPSVPPHRQTQHQVAPLLERPVGMALYEYRNGQIGPLSIQSGGLGGVRLRCCLMFGSW